MRRPVCIIGLAYVVVILLYLYKNPYPQTSYEMYDGSTVVVTGQVDKKEYRISKEQEILVIYLKEVQFINSNVTGLICYMQGTRENVEEPKMGSHVCIKGKFREFSQATNPGEFDAKEYYQILNLHGRIQNGILLEESTSYDEFREGLFKIKQYCAGILELCFLPKEASIMKAMLLGEKSQLDEEVKELYQLNGVIHILSISGLHISIIGMGLYKILCKLRLPKFINIPLAIVFMYCYGVMTDMSVSAIRAIMMFGFHISAELCKRTYDMLTAMAIAALSILIQQPLYLYHSGFLFSFGAILGIGLLAPLIEENLLGETKIEKIMSINLAVSVFTFPVYLSYYYEYPIYSLLLNLLVIPGTSFLLSDGLLSLAGASLYLPLGKYLALPSQLLLAVYEMFCNIFLKLPGNRSILGEPAMWQIAIFACIICIVIFGSKKWSKLQFWQWILLAFFCITMRFSDGLQITFLDVGQGDCIYIADEKGGHYLIDGGSTTKSDVGTYQMIPFLKSKGVAVLDAVFVTHLDEDHYNGITTLLEQTSQGGIEIRNLILPDICEKNKNAAYYDLVNQALQQKIPVLYIHSGEILQHGKLKLTCLHPNECENKQYTTNEESIVLYLEYEDFTALFTGDLEGTGEEEVRKKAAELDKTGDGITLLKVAHHGSKYSTGEEFLEQITPQVAVISCGEDNQYGHPHSETLERLSEEGAIIFTTPEYGAITVEVGRTFRIQGWKVPMK